MMSMENIKVGIWNNELARRQGYKLIDQLKTMGVKANFEIETIQTKDHYSLSSYDTVYMDPRRRNNIDIQHSLQEQAIDLAVFSLTEASLYVQDDFILATFLERGDSRHAYIGRTHIPLLELPEASVVGLRNERMAAFFKACYPQLEPVVMKEFIYDEIERLRRGAYDGIVLSVFDLKQLNLLEMVTEYIDLDTLLPEAGQGVLAVKCRKEDERLIQLLQKLNDPKTETYSRAEREFVRLLDEDYMAPICVHAWEEMEQIRLQGAICAIDGTGLLRVDVTGDDWKQVARKAVDKALTLGAGEMIERAKEVIFLQQSRKF